jgi:hypothetical protein
MAKTVRALITIPDGFDGRPDNTLPGGGGGHPWLPGHGGDGRPDNELPDRPGHPWLGGRPDRPDNALPGYGRPDNSLPVAPARPENPIVLPPGLVDPGFGNRPPTDPGYGQGRPRPPRPDAGPPGGKPERPDNELPGRPERPDNSLPLPPGHPDNSLPPGLGNGNFPIYLPPGSIAPGLPTLPIVLPTYLPEGSCLVIPVPATAQPKDVPEGMQLAVLWYGPGTMPTIAHVQIGAAPTPK